MYDFLLVINTNLPPILHGFRHIAVDRSEIDILVFNSPDGGVPWDDLPHKNEILGMPMASRLDRN